MKKKTAALVVSVVIALSAIGVFVYLRTRPPAKVPNIVTQLGGQPVASIYQFDQDICPGPAVDFKNLDVHLKGAVDAGETVRVILNYYACHPPQVGDVVLYRYSWHHEPVLKRIVAVPGDEVDMVVDPEGRGWNLVLNGKVYESSGRRYHVGVSKHPPPLKLYADANSKKLQPEHLVVLSTVPPGDKDSGYYGVVSIHDIVGRVEK